MKKSWVIDWVVKDLLPPVLMLVLLLGVWHFYVKWSGVKELILPSPMQVVEAIQENWKELLRATWVSTKAAVMGFSLSVVLGVTSAVLMSMSAWVRRAAYPYTVFFQTVPIVVIAPQLIIWFGYGLKPIVVSAFIVSVFPIIANTLTGMLSVDPSLEDMFRLYRAGWFSTLFKLRLPSALPNIFTGMRIAAGLAVIGTIVGEFVASFISDDSGLGLLVSSAFRSAETAKGFGGVLLASVLGLGLFWVISFASWLTLRHWHASAQES